MSRGASQVSIESLDYAGDSSRSDRSQNPFDLSKSYVNKKQAASAAVAKVLDRIQLSISINQLGVSLIANYKGANKELNYVLLQQVNAKFI